MPPPENAYRSRRRRKAVDPGAGARAGLSQTAERARHDYKRHGTTTLFAALDLASGAVVGRHYKKRRRVEFLDFMNQVVTAYPGREIHVVLDNLSTHKPKRDMWLKRNKNVHFHYTPTHASWLKSKSGSRS